MGRLPIVLLLLCSLHSSLARSDPRRLTPDTVGGIVCLNSSFLCNDGRCIPPTWKCDGDYDCLGREDEEGCSESCGEEEWQCGSSPTSPASLHPSLSCIPKKWKCDGELDCDDRSDEANCDTVTCSDKQFACSEYDGKFKLCIPKSWVCDGQRDCASGEDEAKCEDAKKCEANEFNCGNDVCIFSNWKCDGEDDCGNGEDEKGCNKSIPALCNTDTMFKCTLGEGCVPKEWRCDGEMDCHDASDEKGCEATALTCKLDSEFACRSGHHCINRLWKCDGERDCADGSDEDECNYPTKCPEGQKQCEGGSQCLPESLWCDGLESCPNGDDEANCPAKNVTYGACEEGRDYTCPSAPALCIPFSKLCADSRQYSCGDDLTCAADIIMCKEGSDACTCRKSFANKTVCHCNEGYVAKDNKCQDVNECETPGRCDQKCENMPGTYRCSCHAHYVLTRKKDETIPSHCRAMGGDPLVLLSNRAMIRQYDMVTNEHLPLIESPGSAVAMDFHMNNETLVWSDISLKKIMMCKIGNANVSSHLAVKDKCGANEQTVLVEGDVHTPDGLALDWVHDLLFWTDGALDTISVMDLRTRRRRVLFNDNLEEPRAIAVDPEKGLIFWSDWGKEARIERAGMDGENRRTILSGKNIKWPNGLALDLLDKRLYWADAKVKSIYSSDYYGLDVKVVLHSHSYLRHPFSLAVFENRVYYTDWEHDGVISVNKFTGSDVTTLMSKVPTPMTVRIYHKAAQPDHINKCEDHDCNGDSLCLPRAMIRTASFSSESIFTDRPYSCVCQGDAAIDKFECIVDTMALTQGYSLPTMFFLLVVALSAIGGYVFYRRKTHSNSFSALHFDNPVYRRTTEPEMEESLGQMDDMEVPVHPSQLTLHNASIDDSNTMIDSMTRPLAT